MRNYTDYGLRIYENVKMKSVLLIVKRVFPLLYEYMVYFSEMKSLENSHEPYVIALERIDQNHVKYALLLHQYESWSDYETIEVNSFRRL